MSMTGSMVPRGTRYLSRFLLRGGMRSSNQAAQRGLVVAEHHRLPGDHHRPPDEIRVASHEFDGLRTRGGMLRHAALAIEFVARVEEQAVVARANELIQLARGKRLRGEITRLISARKANRRERRRYYEALPA